MRLSLTLLLLAALPLSADALEDLKATLERFTRPEPLRAQVDYTFWSRSGDDKKPEITQGKAAAWVEEGPAGLRMGWGRPLLQAALQEARARALDPGKGAPTRQALDALSPTDILEYLNGAEELLRSLEQARIEDVRDEPWQGRPARLLRLKVSPRLGERQQKYVKSLEATAKVWVGPDGVPLAAEHQMRIKGRALMVVSFESSQKEEFHFGIHGGRLVVLRHTRETSSSGAGEREQRKTQMNLTPQGN